MQANYPDKHGPPYWDPVHLKYPVRKFPDTGLSSEAVARGCRSEPEVLKPVKTGYCETKCYNVDHTVRNDLIRSQTAVDYSFKIPETNIFNKHTSVSSINYVYPPRKNLCDRVPNIKAHGVSEARDKYRSPVLDSKLVTDKEQYKRHNSIEPCEPMPKDIEPLFFDYNGLEKYLDPYVTTSRLHHRSFAAEQTDRTRNIVTYYTCSDMPWLDIFLLYSSRPVPDGKQLASVCNEHPCYVKNIGQSLLIIKVRSRKPNTTEWSLPKSRTKSVYDREKFKDEVREIRTHNKLQWVPNSFRTEVRDNFAPKPGYLDTKVYSMEERVRAFHSKTMASMKTRELEEDLASKRMYRTENSVVGSGKPLCAVFDPYVEQNKRISP